MVSLTSTLLNSSFASSGSSSGTSSLLGDQSLELGSMRSVLQAAYSPAETQTDTVELSSGLAAFIENNVADENTKTSLLANLEAITSMVEQMNNSESTFGQDAVSALFGDGGQSGILNLLA